MDTQMDKMDPRFEHASGTDKDLLEKGAILQRDGTYAIAPHIPGGVILDPNLLIKIAEVAKRYKCAALKVTSSQRIALVGLKAEDIDAAWEDLGMDPGAAIGLCVRSVKFCPGTTFCKRGQQDSVGLGMEADKRYHGMTLPNKLKISISGCANKCMNALNNDIGLMGTPRGYTMYVGGTGGVKPRMGVELVSNIDDQEALKLMDDVINYYKENAKTHERLGRMIDRIGWEEFQVAILGEVQH